MSDDRYDIYFAGECLEGRQPEAVRAALGKLFKADEATLERLFSGSPERIKRGADKATALKYQKAMAAVGARALIRHTMADAPAAASAPPAAPSAAAKERTQEPMAPAEHSSDRNTGDAAAALTLAAVGSDVLRPDERPAEPEVHIDLEHLELAAAGSQLGLESSPAAPAAVPPDYEIAEVGSDLAPQRPTVAADTAALGAGITLKDGEHDLSDCAPPPPVAPQVNLEQFSLAESGSDLLSEADRPRNHASAPDTGHLTLADDEN